MLHFNQNQFTETTGTLTSYSYRPYRFNIPRKIKRENLSVWLDVIKERREEGGDVFIPFPFRMTYRLVVQVVKTFFFLIRKQVLNLLTLHSCYHWFVLILFRMIWYQRIRQYRSSKKEKRIYNWHSFFFLKKKGGRKDVCIKQPLSPQSIFKLH